MKNKKSKQLKLCSFPGCSKPHCAKGLCNTHWAQNARIGKLSPILTEETAEERFFRQTKIPEDPNGCWIFTGNGSGSGKKSSTDSCGYGQLWHKGKKVMAHRYSYEKFTSEKIPKGLQLDHVCRVKNCVNPKHLQIVTQDENLRRMNYSNSLIRRVEELEKNVKILIDYIENTGYTGIEFLKKLDIKGK